MGIHHSPHAHPIPIPIPVGIPMGNYPYPRQPWEPCQCLRLWFHHHATRLHVIYRRVCRRPDGVSHVVDAADGTVPKPPTMTALPGAAATRETVVVVVRGTKHHPVGDVVRVPWHHRITGVSSVPGHSHSHQLYPATVRRYFPASSLMENVEYSAEYHRPEVRWICVYTQLLHAEE